MSFFPGSFYPVVSPAHNAANARAKYLLDFEVGMGRLAEEVMARLSYHFLPRVKGAVRGWVTVFEDTIVAYKLHHTGDIMTNEGLVVLKDDADH
jgi:hypothetical protein